MESFARILISKLEENFFSQNSRSFNPTLSRMQGCCSAFNEERLQVSDLLLSTGVTTAAAVAVAAAAAAAVAVPAVAAAAAVADDVCPVGSRSCLLHMDYKQRPT